MAVGKRISGGGRDSALHSRASLLVLLSGGGWLASLLSQAYPRQAGLTRSYGTDIYGTVILHLSTYPMHL